MIETSIETMLVTVIGKRYVSKKNMRTGRVIRNCVIHYSYPEKSIEGQAVAERWIGSFCYPPSLIEVGRQYEMQQRGDRVVKFAAIEDQGGSDV